MQGIALALRRLPHQLLDLERGVPFLKLLVLKGKCRRCTACANQRVLIDEQIEYTWRWRGRGLPRFHEAIDDLLDDEAGPIIGYRGVGCSRRFDRQSR